MPQPALDFLKLILPSEGLKCAAIFAGKRVTQRFTPSIEELAQIIQSADAAGFTAYHACASYQTGDSRKAANVLRAKALWLDVDYGPNHAQPGPYADAQAAAEAVVAFCRSAPLPIPVFVGSGNGLHLYWPLVEAVAPHIWLAAAKALKRLCDHHALAVDAVRTCDLASILRTPGTHNRKHSEQVVRCGEPVGPFRLADLGLLTDAEPPAERAFAGGARHAAFPVRRSLIAGALALHAEQPNYAEPIAEQCAQLAALRDSLGRIAEPVWYAALGVLAHCADGEGFAHHWSSGYPGYSHQETQARLERARNFGPTTCEKFQGVNASGCDGCPVRDQITSPIQLGRARLSSVVPPAPQNPVLETLDCAVEEVDGEQLPKLPGHFRWHSRRALTFIKEGNDGEDIYEIVSTYPLYLKGVQTGEINGEQFSLRFGLELPNELSKELTLGAKTIFSATGTSEISGKGAVIHDNDLFKKYAREAVDMWNADYKLDKRFEQYGWKDDGSFLCGPALYFRGETTPILGADEVKIRNQWLGPCKGGNIGKWSRAANALFTKGCEPQSFALLGAFAAPLMRFHSSGEGGSIISLVNDQSGSGKTTALEAVESVWGRKEAIRLTDDDTRVSKSLILGVLANLPVTWDELYNRDPEKIREFVLMFTNGRDKMRGTQDGALRHSKASWSTILTLASNNSIVDILQTNTGTDAPSYRVMEFQTEIPSGVARKGDDLKRALRDNSGYAGHAYLQLLTKPEVLGFIIEALPKWTEQVWHKSKLSNEHRFWVRTIASVMAASVLVNKLGILEFSTDRITDWAIEYAQGGLPNAENKADASVVFSQFLAENVLNTLVVATAWKPRTELRPLIEPRRELQVRYERDSQRIYINESFLRKWLVANNVSIRTFLRRLKDMNVVLRDGRRLTLGAGTDYASGQSVCYEIDGAHPAVKGGLREVLDIPGETRKERVEKYQASLT